jgi:hypothetical protein
LIQRDPETPARCRYGERIAFGAQRIDDLAREWAREMLEESQIGLLRFVRLLATLLCVIASRRDSGLNAFADL